MIGCENYSEAEIRDKMYVNLLHPRSSMLKFLSQKTRYWNGLKLK